MVLLACSPTQIPDSQAHIALEGLIQIPSVAEYEALAESRNVDALARFADKNFIPLLQKGTLPEAHPLAQDPFLQNLLNEDYLVAIDAWVFRMDFDQARVFAMEKSSLNRIDLVSGNLENPDLMVFSLRGLEQLFLVI